MDCIEPLENKDVLLNYNEDYLDELDLLKVELFKQVMDYDLKQNLISIIDEVRLMRDHRKKILEVFNVSKCNET